MTWVQAWPSAEAAALLLLLLLLLPLAGTVKRQLCSHFTYECRASLQVQLENGRATY